LVRTRPEGAFDTIVVVDCSDLERTGNALRGLPQPDLNIDHHQTNLNFARLNLVDTRAVATAELVYAILKEMQVKITPDIARALLTGVITDTIGFRTSNVGADTLRLAAELIEAGADLPDLYRRALVNRSFEAFRYWGAGLSKLNQEGRLVWTALTLEDRKAANYAGRDDADLINQLGAVENSDVAIVFVEQSKKRVKVSWRAQPGYDVSAIALRFGGGGHPAASGAEVDGRMEEVIEKVLQATRPILNGKTPRTGRDSLS
jgi:phosphoesterase RecJ-like protein